MTGSPLISEVSGSSTVVEVVEVVEVDVVELVEVVGSDVVEESAASLGLHAATNRARATSLATVVRIVAIVRSSAQLHGIVAEGTAEDVEVGERGDRLIDRDGQLDPVGVRPQHVQGVDVDACICK